MKVKSIFIVFLTILMLFTICNVCRADSKILDPGDYDPNSRGGLTASDYDQTMKMVSNVFSVIYTVGIVVSVVMVIVLGIKYMIGSVEQRAEYKKTMPPVIIGIVLVFAVTTVVRFIISIMQDINSGI